MKTKLVTVLCLLVLSGFQSVSAEVETLNYSQSLKCEYSLPQLRSADRLIYVDLEAGFNLRSSPVSGSVKVLVPKGSRVSVDLFQDRKQVDGYRWMYVQWGLYKGYMQYDPALMSTYGSQSGTGLRIQLDRSSARIRTSPVNGTSLKLISISDSSNSPIHVYEIQATKSSDGYRWMYVQWGVYTGYMQYDPYVMHLVG